LIDQLSRRELAAPVAGALQRKRAE
jgi:hypothetical protein